METGNESNKTYLGDGVYARFDGFGVVLTTEDGINATNTIYLDAKVLNALNEYVKRMNA